MSLWKFVCSVLLCSSVRKRKHLRVVGRFFSHRAHRVHGGFWRTFRAHRTPSAYRGHRGLSTIIITNKGHNEAYILSIGVSRWLLPFPSGEGTGEGPPLALTPVCSVLLCSLWEKICHSLFVIMSFCLKKYICLPLSLCHSVSKITPVFFCHYVILSKKIHLSPSVPLLFCLQNYPICYSRLTLLPCLPYPVSPVLGYSVFQVEARGEESGKSFPAHGEL